ncbi:MAG: S1 RNA-binding domain-containing protein [Actinobacteria bacterium]|nr:S1 RNA-binding domain-containing protein [Actinomycetota bacterium]
MDMSEEPTSSEGRIRPVFIGDSRRLFCRDVTGLECSRVMQDEAENCGIESHVRIVPIGAYFGDPSYRTRSSFHRRKLIVDEDYDLVFDESRDAVDFDKSTFNPKDLWVSTTVQKEFTAYHKGSAEDAISNIQLLIEKSIQKGNYYKLSRGGHLFKWKGYLAILTPDLRTVVRYQTSHYERTPRQVVDGVKSRLRKNKPSRGPIPDSIMLGVIVDGTISSTVNFGAFVRISPDFDALLHNSELGQLMESEERPLEIGEGVRVEVISVDHDRNQVGLRLIGRNNLGASEI